MRDGKPNSYQRGRGLRLVVIRAYSWLIVLKKIPGLCSLFSAVRQIRELWGVEGSYSELNLVWSGPGGKFWAGRNSKRSLNPSQGKSRGFYFEASGHRPGARGGSRLNPSQSDLIRAKNDAFEGRGLGQAPGLEHSKTRSAMWMIQGDSDQFRPLWGGDGISAGPSRNLLHLDLDAWMFPRPTCLAAPIPLSSSPAFCINDPNSWPI